MRILAITTIATLVTVAVPASPVAAQDITTEFRGFRIEGNIGGDRFQSLGEHNTKLGYGATAGFDGVIAGKIVVGPEATYWRANNWSENCGSGVNGGSVCSKSFQEYGAAVRVGYLITPNLLVFGKGGYVNNEQRKRFDATSNLFYVNGQIVGPEKSYYNHGRTDGYQVGGGVEYTLGDHMSSPLSGLYVSAQYVFSDYYDHTSRQRAMGGVGIRFK